MQISGLTRVGVVSVFIVITLGAATFFWWYENAPPPTPVLDSAPQPAAEPTPPAAAKSEAKVVYEGLVVDAFGEPLAGVEVRVDDGTNSPSSETIAYGRAGGRFALELPRTVVPLARLRKLGYTTVLVQLAPSDAAETERTYVLLKGGVLAGRLLNESRGPVVVGEVEIAGQMGYSDRTRVLPNGGFTLTAPAGPVIVTARSPQLADASFLDVKLSIGETTQREFVLSAGATLEVTVHTEGTCVAGAQLEIYGESGERERAVSTAEGNAELDGLAAGSGTLLIVALGYEEQLVPVQIVAGGTVKLPIELRRARPRAYEIVDANGEPIAEALCVVTRSGREIQRFTTASSGSFDVLAWDRKYKITVTAPGFAPFRDGIRFNDSSGGLPVRFVLERGRKISGQALDANGAGVAGAVVWFLAAPRSGETSTHSIGPEQQVVTGLRGKFTSPLLAPGKYQVSVVHSLVGQVRKAAELTAAGDLDLGALLLATP
ncbi:MAG: collagen binding domain-containing protein [Planctomycetota bacterium]